MKNLFKISAMACAVGLIFSSCNDNDKKKDERPGEPTGLKTVIVTHNAASLEWNAVEYADQYQFVSQAAGIDTLINEAKFGMTGLEETTTYDWKVRSRKGDYESNWKEGESFTTPLSPDYTEAWLGEWGGNISSVKVIAHVFDGLLPIPGFDKFEIPVSGYIPGLDTVPVNVNVTRATSHNSLMFALMGLDDLPLPDTLPFLDTLMSIIDIIPKELKGEIKGIGSEVDYTEMINRTEVVRDTLRGDEPISLTGILTQIVNMPEFPSMIVTFLGLNDPELLASAALKNFSITIESVRLSGTKFGTNQMTLKLLANLHFDAWLEPARILNIVNAIDPVQFEVEVLLEKK